MKKNSNAAAIVERLKKDYQQSVANLRKDLAALSRQSNPARSRSCPLAKERYCLSGAPAADLCRQGPGPRPAARLLARFGQSGVYVSTITRPDLFRSLSDPNSCIAADGRLPEFEIEVLRSEQEIPFRYVLDGSEGAGRRGSDRVGDQRVVFGRRPIWRQIGDEIADGIWSPQQGEERPLTLFDAPAHGLFAGPAGHYTGTPVDLDPERYVLFYELSPLCR